MELQPSVEIEAVWKDEAMLEIQVAASNSHYAGATKVYTTGEDLIQFANSMRGFPQSSAQILDFEAGVHGGYAYFSMKLYCIDGMAHTATQLKLEENNFSRPRPEAKDRVQLELLFEPASLDNFLQQLLDLGKTESGKATLIGKAI